MHIEYVRKVFDFAQEEFLDLYQIDLNIDYLYIDIVRNLFLKNNRINCISHAHFYYWFEFVYRWVILKKVHHY